MAGHARVGGWIGETRMWFPYLVRFKKTNPLPRISLQEPYLGSELTYFPSPWLNSAQVHPIHSLPSSPALPQGCSRNSINERISRSQLIGRGDRELPGTLSVSLRMC